MLDKAVRAWRRFCGWLDAVKSRSVQQGSGKHPAPRVRLVPVTTPEQDQLAVGMYARNPSSFLVSPKTMAELKDRQARGTEYFLLYNAADELIGARGFRPVDALLQHSVVDKGFRGQGYWQASDAAMDKLLAERGFTHVHGNVFANNARIQHAMLATGWKLEPHPTEKDLIKGTKKLPPAGGGNK